MLYTISKLLFKYLLLDRQKSKIRQSANEKLTKFIVKDWYFKAIQYISHLLQYFKSLYALFFKSSLTIFNSLAILSRKCSFMQPISYGKSQISRYLMSYSTQVTMKDFFFVSTNALGFIIHSNVFKSRPSSIGHLVPLMCFNK